jgi:hypothetical protein
MSSQSEERETVCDISLLFLLLKASVCTERYIGMIRRQFSQLSDDKLPLIVHNLCSSLTFDNKWCPGRKKKLAPSSILREAKVAYYARNMFEAGRFVLFFVKAT